MTALRPRCRSGSRPGMSSIRRFGRSFRTSAITRAGTSLGSKSQWGAWRRAFADGSQSETRRRLLPNIEPRYAGHVAWRGTIDEERVPPGLARFFDQSFTFSETRSGGHILSYLIPGPGAAIEHGRRRINWVWYVNVTEGPELDRLLTDRTGEPHRASGWHGAARANVGGPSDGCARVAPTLRPFNCSNGRFVHGGMTAGRLGLVNCRGNGTKLKVTRPKDLFSERPRHSAR